MVLARKVSQPRLDLVLIVPPHGLPRGAGIRFSSSFVAKCDRPVSKPSWRGLCSHPASASLLRSSPRHRSSYFRAWRLRNVDSPYEDSARTLGDSIRDLLTVTAPLAWRGIAAGIALCFARAIGEFGATLMLAGNIPGRTQTASVAIYDAVQAGRIEQATSMALALAVLAGGALLTLARVGRGARW